MLNTDKIYIDPMDLREYSAKMNIAYARKLVKADAEEEKQEEPEKKTEAKNEKSSIDRPKNLKNDQINKNKLDGLVQKTDNVLLKVSNIVPMLTTDIIIDSSKVSVVYRPFPLSERIHSISVKNITDVYIETVPFFATLNIIDTGFVENLVKVTWLLKSDAEKARRIITALMQANKENIDLKLIQDKELGPKLEEIGKVRDSKTTVSNSASII